MAKPTKTAPTIAEVPEAPAAPEAETVSSEPAAKVKAQENEFGGPKGPEPKRNWPFPVVKFG